MYKETEQQVGIKVADGTAVPATLVTSQSLDGEVTTTAYTRSGTVNGRIIRTAGGQ